MSKANRLLLLALVVQTVILFATAFAGREEVVTKAAKVFEGFEPEKVTKIKIDGDLGINADAKGPQKSVTMEKQGTTWGVATADQYPVDATKVDTLLKNVQKLMARGAVVTKKAYHKKLEVAEDKYQRLVTITHDGKELGFYLGSSPSFKNVHLRKTGSDDVVLVQGLTVWDVGASASDWVSRDYVKVPESDVWALKLQNKNGVLQMEKSPDGQWAVTGLGPTDKIKKTAVDDLVRKASSIQLEEPMGKTQKPEFGLGQPLATVTLVTGTSTIAGMPPKTTETRQIAIGNKIDPDNRYYVKASSSDYVVTAAGWAVEQLVTKTAKELVEEPPKPEEKKK